MKHARQPALPAIVLLAACRYHVGPKTAANRYPCSPMSCSHR